MKTICVVYPPGIPTAMFPVILITDVVTVCEKKPDLYETNADCAQAVDTCLTYFPG